MLVPQSSWAVRKVDHWDYASLAVLARSLLEVRLAFYYLCIQECPPAEWECRWNLLNLHDCTTRIDMFKEMQSHAEELSELEQTAKNLCTQLEANEFFKNLQPKKKRHFLRGKNAYLIPLQEIAESCGVEKTTFRWLYKFLSNHVHGYPMSYYRIGQGVQERGRGVHSPIEEFYCRMLLSLVISQLIGARDEMSRLFSVEHLTSKSM